METTTTSRRTRKRSMRCNFCKGVVPLAWSLDHAGPLTRRVRDAALMLQAMATVPPRHDDREPVAIPDYLEHIEDGAKGLRVGVPKHYFWDKIDADVERVVRAAIATLESAGAELREVDCSDARASKLIWKLPPVQATTLYTAWSPRVLP